MGDHKMFIKIVVGLILVAVVIAGIDILSAPDITTFGPSRSSSSTSSNNSSGSSSKSLSKPTCGFKYADGSVCGLKTNKYDGLCDYHFEQLDSIYNDLVG